MTTSDVAFMIFRQCPQDIRSIIQYCSSCRKLNALMTDRRFDHHWLNLAAQLSPAMIVTFGGGLEAPLNLDALRSCPRLWGYGRESQRFIMGWHVWAYIANTIRDPHNAPRTFATFIKNTIGQGHFGKVHRRFQVFSDAYPEQIGAYLAPQTLITVPKTRKDLLILFDDNEHIRIKDGSGLVKIKDGSLSFFRATMNDEQLHGQLFERLGIKTSRWGCDAWLRYTYDKTRRVARQNTITLFVLDKLIQNGLGGQTIECAEFKHGLNMWNVENVVAYTLRRLQAKQKGLTVRKRAKKTRKRQKTG